MNCHPLDYFRNPYHHIHRLSHAIWELYQTPEPEPAVFDSVSLFLFLVQNQPCLTLKKKKNTKTTNIYKLKTEFKEWKTIQKACIRVKNIPHGLGALRGDPNAAYC